MTGFQPSNFVLAVEGPIASSSLAVDFSQNVKDFVLFIFFISITSNVAARPRTVISRLVN
jgi:hypothetical protein